MPEGTTGYLFGIFDLFHITHLDAIRLAAASCDRLVVGVAGDDLVEHTCGVRPFVPAVERLEIVGAVRTISQVHLLDSLDLPTAARSVRADLVFLPGDDLDVVQLAVLNSRSGQTDGWAGLFLTALSAGRPTNSSQVRTALAGTTTRSSVA